MPKDYQSRQSSGNMRYKPSGIGRVMGHEKSPKLIKPTVHRGDVPREPLKYNGYNNLAHDYRF